MHWLYLVAAVACFALAMISTLPTFVVLLLLAAALGCLVAWILGWLSTRIASQSRDVANILGPDELRRLREQAEARRSAEPAPRTPVAGSGEGPGTPP